MKDRKYERGCSAANDMIFWEGFVFWGNDINRFEIENEEMCMNVCRTFPLCFAIAYRRTDNMCYLKEKDSVFLAQINSDYSSACHNLTFQKPKKASSYRRIVK